jgi:hypothetical protein
MMRERADAIQYAVIRHGAGGDDQAMLDGFAEPIVLRAIVGSVEARDAKTALVRAGQTNAWSEGQSLEVIAYDDLDEGDRREFARVRRSQDNPLGAISSSK